MQMAFPLQSMLSCRSRALIWSFFHAFHGPSLPRSGLLALAIRLMSAGRAGAGAGSRGAGHSSARQFSQPTLSSLIILLLSHAI